MSYEDPMVAAQKLIRNLTASIDLLESMNRKLREALHVEQELNRRINEERMDQDYVEDRMGHGP
jgi:hypothetical protein